MREDKRNGKSVIKGPATSPWSMTLLDSIAVSDIRGWTGRVVEVYVHIDVFCMAVSWDVCGERDVFCGRYLKYVAGYLSGYSECTGQGQRPRWKIIGCLDGGRERVARDACPFSRGKI